MEQEWVGLELVEDGGIECTKGCTGRALEDVGAAVPAEGVRHGAQRRSRNLHITFGDLEVWNWHRKELHGRHATRTAASAAVAHALPQDRSLGTELDLATIAAAIDVDHLRVLIGHDRAVGRRPARKESV